MPDLVSIGAIFVVVIAAVAIVARLQTVIVYEGHRGLRYRNGKFDGLLEPGRYRIWRPTTSVRSVDVRIDQEVISGQELVTSDGISVKISLTVQQRLVDPAKAVMEIANYEEAARSVLQIALREVVGSLTGDDVLAKRSDIGTQVFDRSVEKVKAVGLELLAVDVRDLMLPAATKRLFAQVVEARQRGLAALEQARGETAALRSLANAASLVEKSPVLYQLRLLQQMESSSGNTFVVGAPASVTPVRASPRPATGNEAPTD